MSTGHSEICWSVLLGGIILLYPWLHASNAFDPFSLQRQFLSSGALVSYTKLEGLILLLLQSNANKKEQSALRAVIKCVEDHKLEAEFPLEDLRERLEELEKAKTEKKKAASSSSSGGSSGPANKRIRASTGGPMPPAKAGRLTDYTGTPSSPATTTTNATFIRSPSHASYGTASPYSYDRPAAHPLYCGQNTLAMREPYAYHHPSEVSSVGLGMSYPSPPMTYPAYAGYSNGIGYSNAMAPAFHHQAYYR